MNLNADLLFLIFYIPCVAFGALTIIENPNQKVASIPTNSDHQSRMHFLDLPNSIIFEVSKFLDSPFTVLPRLCRLVHAHMEIMKNSQKLILQRRTIHPHINEFNWSIELHRMLKLDTIILNEFFYDFLASKHCFKVMNKIILNYFIQNVIDKSSANVEYIQNLADELFQQFLDERKYDLIEFLIIRVYDKNNLNIIGKCSAIKVPMELVQYLYTNNKYAIEFLIKQDSCRESTISGLFNTHVTIEDLVNFLKDGPTDSCVLELMISSMLECETSFTSEEKVFILNRNQQFLEDLPGTENEHYHILIAEACNIVRYSEIADTEVILNKYFSESSELQSDSSTETVAKVAFIAGNLDIFLKMHQVRNETKFSVEFYKLVSSSQQIMGILSDNILMSYFEIPEENISPETMIFDFTLRLEILARKDATLRTLPDLDGMFLNDEFGKLIAVAFYYPIEDLIDVLKKISGSILPLLVKKCIFYSSKVRNVRNKLIHIINAIFSFAYSFVSAAQLRKPFADRRSNNLAYLNISCYLFGDLNFLKLLVDPENLGIFDCKDMCFYFNNYNIFTELRADSKFKKNISGPRAAALRDATNICFCTFFEEKLLSHEVVELLGVLGAEIGNFDFESLEIEPNAEKANLLTNDIVKVAKLNNVNIGKEIAQRALKSFNNQKSDFYGEFNMNLLLLDSFGVFQVWRERNLKTFKQFAPKEIDDIFEERIARFKATKFDK